MSRYFRIDGDLLRIFRTQFISVSFFAPPLMHMPTIPLGLLVMLDWTITKNARWQPIKIISCTVRKSLRCSTYMSSVSFYLNGIFGHVYGIMYFKLSTIQMAISLMQDLVNLNFVETK